MPNEALSTINRTHPPTDRAKSYLNHHRGFSFLPGDDASKPMASPPDPHPPQLPSNPTASDSENHTKMRRMKIPRPDPTTISADLLSVRTSSANRHRPAVQRDMNTLGSASSSRSASAKADLAVAAARAAEGSVSSVETVHKLSRS